MKNFLVKDNMSKNILTVCWSEVLQPAYDKMKKANVRHLVVTDEYGYLRGIISERDFQRAMHLSNDFLFREDGLTGFDPVDIVRDFMSWPAEVVSSNTKLKEVAEKMIENKISAVVISDDHMDATGIITHEDLLRVLVKLLSENPSLKERLEGIIYKSPIGEVINMLKEVGI